MQHPQNSAPTFGSGKPQQDYAFLKALSDASGIRLVHLYLLAQGHPVHASPSRTRLTQALTQALQKGQL